MRIVSNSLLVRLSVLIGLSLTLVSCSGVAGALRQVTYPPGFTYVSREQLTSRMHELGYELQQLDQALGPDNQALSEQQQQVVTILNNIERVAGGIQAGEAGSNHPFLQNDMATFMATVGQARVSAGLNPPRYYEAGRVSGSCANCHRLNRD
jgi:hypothetical protein